MLIVAGSHLMRMDYIVEEGYNLLHIYAEPPFAQLKLRLNYPFLTLVDLHMNGVKDNPTSALKELASEANFLATNRMGPVIEENVKQCHDVAMVNIKEYSSQDERIYSTVNINGIFQMQGLYRSLSVPKDIIPYLPVVSGLDFKKKFEEKAAEFLITSNLMDNIANSKYVAFVNHYSDPKMERYWNSGLIQPNYRIGEHEDYVLYADSLCGIVLPIQHRPDYTVLGGSLVVANDLRLGTNGNHEGRIIREIRPGVTYNEVFSHPQLVEYRSNKVIYMLTHVHGTIMPVVDEYASSIRLAIRSGICIAQHCCITVWCIAVAVSVTSSASTTPPMRKM